MPTREYIGAHHQQFVIPVWLIWVVRTFQKVFHECALYYCTCFTWRRTFIKNSTCPAKFRRELFVKIFTAKKPQDLVNEKLVTWSSVLVRMFGNRAFNIEVAKDKKNPERTGFWKYVNLEDSIRTRIGNCRSISGSPTDINVVCTMLINVNKVLTNLGQTDPCITADESIYAIAKRFLVRSRSSRYNNTPWRFPQS